MRYLTPLTVLFFVLLTVEIIGDSLGYDIVGWVCKPFLMPVLMVLFFTNNKGNNRAERILFPLALLFSLAGDVLLMFHKDNLFVFGLASFLVAHIFFIASFWSRIKGRNIAIGTYLLSLLPFVVFVGGFLSVLIPSLQAKEVTQPLVVPVSVYACVIGIMGFSALMRRAGVSTQGFNLVFVGALFFIISDSCIALNHFIMPIPQPTLLIMATYGIAQYLITVGTAKQ
ncbi:MAG: lysoplasmalogenase [Sphingobacteriales bacterium JAD_PAG50586_3]|nr:MAG: lysoplasmalogenase [Sphingobacteriales bacterium JAD_PAG50586_3]